MGQGSSGRGYYLSVILQFMFYIVPVIHYAYMTVGHFHTHFTFLVAVFLVRLYGQLVQRGGHLSVLSSCCVCDSFYWVQRVFVLRTEIGTVRHVERGAFIEATRRRPATRSPAGLCPHPDTHII